MTKIVRKYNTLSLNCSFYYKVAYFAMAVNYTREKCMKLTPEANVIKHFTAVSYEL